MLQIYCEAFRPSFGGLEIFVFFFPRPRFFKSKNVLQLFQILITRIFCLLKCPLVVCMHLFQFSIPNFFISENVLQFSQFCHIIGPDFFTGLNVLQLFIFIFFSSFQCPIVVFKLIIARFFHFAKCPLVLLFLSYYQTRFFNQSKCPLVVYTQLFQLI